MVLKLANFTVNVENFSPLVDTNVNLIPKGIIASSFRRAWNGGYTGKDIIIAVIDTGIDKQHPDLKNKIIKSYNLTNEGLIDSHGTHVAGTIAANGILKGGAYDSLLIDIKVITKEGAIIDNVVKAIALASNNGATIINMSLGSSDLSSDEILKLNNAVNDAWNRGTICIAAGGNDGTTINSLDVYQYPASINNVVSVAAADVGEDLSIITLAPFSNENDKISLAACGVNVASTIIGGKYSIYSGTSMSTPHVSAMSAILSQYIKSNYPNLSGSSFSSALLSLLYLNVLGITQTNSESISFGLGFLKYRPIEPIIIPTDDNKFFFNNIFVGYTDV